MLKINLQSDMLIDQSLPCTIHFFMLHHLKNGGKGILCYLCSSVGPSLSASKMALAICV